MIRNGDRLENRVTGEGMTFHRTSHETGGEVVQFHSGLPSESVSATTGLRPRLECVAGSQVVGFAPGCARPLS